MYPLCDHVLPVIQFCFGDSELSFPYKCSPSCRTCLLSRLIGSLSAFLSRLVTYVSYLDTIKFHYAAFRPHSLKIWTSSSYLKAIDHSYLTTYYPYLIINDVFPVYGEQILAH